MASKVVPALLAALLAACSCGPSADAASVGPPNRGTTTLADGRAVPIENFAQIDEGFYRGAQPDAAGFAALRELGVRTVVNLRSKHSDVKLAVPAGLQVVEIPMHAVIDSDPPTDDDVRAFFDVALDPDRRPVFVHCAVGKDRTGAMCALYRVEVQRWSPQKAFEEMQAFGFHELYADLREFVLAYRPRGFVR